MGRYVTVHGAKGEQGIQGIQGEPGLQGIQGEQGLQGIQGIQGEPGLQGIQGIAGSNGADGADGADGAGGQGVPVGGTAGQVLAKVDTADYHTQWVDQTGEASDVVTVAQAGSSITLDASAGSAFQTTLTGDVDTIVINNPPGAGQYKTLTWKIVQDATPRSISWPVTGANPIAWPNGGTVPAAINPVTLVTLYTDSEGDPWYGIADERVTIDLSWGGLGRGNSTVIQKYVFATDVASTFGGTLALARYERGVCGTAEEVIHAGGWQSGYNPITTTELLTIATESSTTSGIGLLPTALRGMVASANLTVGIFGGGTTESMNHLSKTNAIEKFTFSSKAFTTEANTLSVGRMYMGSTTDGIHVLFVGGNVTGGSSNTTAIDKYAYSDGSVTTSSGVLSLARYALSGCGNGEKAVFAYGAVAGAAQSAKDVFTYASNVITGGSMLKTVTSAAAASNSTVGIFGGGSNTTTVEKVDFSTEATSYGTALAATVGSSGEATNLGFSTAVGWA